MVYMKRTNIYLDETQYKKLLKVAEGKSTTVSSLIRQMIDESLQHSYESRKKRPIGEVLVEMGRNAPKIKKIKGEPNLTSQNYKEFLYGKYSKYAKNWPKDRR